MLVYTTLLGNVGGGVVKKNKSFSIVEVLLKSNMFSLKDQPYKF
jgi:hypothetical protein